MKIRPSAEEKMSSTEISISVGGGGRRTRELSIGVVDGGSGANSEKGGCSRLLVERQRGGWKGRS